MFVLVGVPDKARDSKLLFLISCHMQAKYNLPIVFSLREVAQKCVELHSKLPEQNFATYWICNYLAPYTTIRDQNNLQVSAFAATRSASCQIQWTTIEI